MTSGVQNPRKELKSRIAQLLFMSSGKLQTVTRTPQVEDVGYEYLHDLATDQMGIVHFSLQVPLPHVSSVTVQFSCFGKARQVSSHSAH